jgi:hypothetical protein
MWISSPSACHTNQVHLFCATAQSTTNAVPIALRPSQHFLHSTKTLKNAGVRARVMLANLKKGVNPG